MATATNPRDDQGGRANSLGLSGRALAAVFDELDSAGDGAPNVRREFVRWPHRLERVFLKVKQPGGPEVVIRVACRNLSRGGIGIIHSAYLHPGSRCAVVLPHLTEGPKAIAGQVMRCQHRRGVLHEVGVRFEAPIDLRNYLPLDSEGDRFSLERVDPSDLEGCVVHLDDSDLDRKIVKHYLRETRLRIRATAAIEEGIAWISEGCDLLIIDQMLGDRQGSDVVKRIRGQGSHVPVILVSADANGDTRKQIEGDESSSFVAKPFTQDKLLRAIGEFLLVRRRGACKSRSDHAAHTGSGPGKIEGDLSEYAKKLARCIEGRDSAGCRAACVQIRGSAPSLGFHELGTLAGEIAVVLGSGATVEDALGQLQSLLSGCTSRTLPEASRTT